MNTNKKHKWHVIFAAVFCAVCVAAMLISLGIPKNAVKGSFAPPSFDSCAEVGAPKVPDLLGYAEPYREGMDFHAGICGNVIIKGDSADVYFTNKAENDVWLMLRITDESGATLAQTGMIRPGEYIKSVRFTQKPEPGQKIIFKIMAYEPDTYYSRGYFTLKTEAKYE